MKKEEDFNKAGGSNPKKDFNSEIREPKEKTPSRYIKEPARLDFSELIQREKK